MIWFNKNVTLEEVNRIGDNTMFSHLGIRFSEIGENYLKATMPVDQRTHQPMGLLHGGASAALSETIGSVAGWMCVNEATHTCVGLEINCNHIRGKKSGIVTATASPFHLGASTHVWDIKIQDERGKLICISRLTLAVLKKK